MATNWRQQISKNPQWIELNRRLKARRRELERDKEFVLETARLRASFESALKKSPKPLHDFLRRFFHPVGPRLREMNGFLSSVRDAQLRGLFRRYWEYVARFGVVFRLKKKRILAEYLVPWGSTFHVRLFKDHFEPMIGFGGDDVPFDYFFESDSVEMPPALRKRLKSGNAKFVRIEDESWSSVLSKMEYFAYEPNCLTFILHNAEQHYLLCLVGEKVTNKLWRNSSKVVSAFLRQYFNRGKAGRPKNLPRFRRMIELRQKPGLLKEKLEPYANFHNLSPRGFHHHSPTPGFFF